MLHEASELPRIVDTMANVPSPQDEGLDSPERRGRISSFTDLFVTCSLGGELRIWRLQDGACIRMIKQEAPFTALTVNLGPALHLL